MNNRCLLLLFLNIIILTSCDTVKKIGEVQGQSFKYSYCTPTVAYAYPLWANDTLQPIPSKYNLSEHDRLLCKVLVINSFVDTLLALSRDSSNNYKRLLLKQRISERLLIAQTGLSAIAGELDCEGERANLAAIYLDNLNAKRNKLLTTTSVILSGLTALATAIITKHSAQVTTGITGGLLSAGLAVLTISPKGKTVAFYHERNLLKSIWEDQANDAEYPLFIWKMMHEKQFSNSGEVTLAQSIKTRWLQFEFNGQINKGQEALLFGKGGYYHSDDLHTRAAMLNQLQSTVRSINQDLAGFVIVMERL